MTVILILIVAVVAVASVWLLRQGIMTKPWLDTGLTGGELRPEFAAGRVGLGLLLVVLGALFALFGSAFVMRMDLELWTSFTLPRIVWVNTAVLLLAGLFLHRAARSDDPEAARRDTLVAGLATLCFLVGQIYAWRHLTATGEGLAASPAASFFYLLSGLHGLHILGGLVALAAVMVRDRATGARLRTGLGLCATYWDFLLVVWGGLLILFLGWANQLAAICRGLLS